MGQAKARGIKESRIQQAKRHVRISELIINFLAKSFLRLDKKNRRWS